MSDDDARVRQIELCRQRIHLGVLAVSLLFCILAAFTVGFFIKESHRLRADRLELKNELLVAEVEEIRAGYASLQSVLEDLFHRDEHYRLVAGLEPLDRDVMRAGIGGPGTETLQSNQLWQVEPELGALTFGAAYDLNELVRRGTLLASSWREATDSLAANHARLRATPSIAPTQGRLSSGFSRSRPHPLLDTARAHEGIDISAPRGTAIVAAADGRVMSVGRRGHYGLMIELDHGHGYVTRYAHASLATVRPGQMVARGERIGEVGSTGLAAGPHLHYEVLVNGRATNPMDFMLAGELMPY